MSQHVLIVEDQATMREFMCKAAVEAFPNANVVCAATVAQAQTMLIKHEFSIALLDISLPDGNGIDLVRHIKQQQSGCNLVMCTIFEDDQHLFDALSAGAKGYLLKEHSFSEMVEQLQQILSGRPPLSPSIANRILEHFHQVAVKQVNSESADALTKNHNLTNREREVLTLVAKGLTRKEVACALNIGIYTVAEHIKNIYGKLDISSRAEATLEAMRIGLITY